MLKEDKKIVIFMVCGLVILTAYLLVSFITKSTLAVIPIIVMASSLPLFALKKITKKNINIGLKYKIMYISLAITIFISCTLFYYEIISSLANMIIYNLSLLILTILNNQFLKE